MTTMIEEIEDLKARVTRLEIGRESRVDSLAAVLAETRGDARYIKSNMATAHDAVQLGQRVDGLSAGYTDMFGAVKRVEESNNKLTVTVNGMAEPLTELRVDMSMVKLGVPSLHQSMVEVRQDIAVLQSDVTVLKADVAVLKSDVTVLKADVAVLKSDVAVLKSDVTVLKADVAVLKSDVAVLKSDVTVLKADVAVLKADVAVLKSDVAELKTGQVQILAMLTQLVGDSAKKSRQPH